MRGPQEGRVEAALSEGNRGESGHIIRRGARRGAQRGNQDWTSLPQMCIIAVSALLHLSPGDLQWHSDDSKNSLRPLSA